MDDSSIYTYYIVPYPGIVLETVCVVIFPRMDYEGHTVFAVFCVDDLCRKNRDGNGGGTTAGFISKEA